MSLGAVDLDSVPVPVVEGAPGQVVRLVGVLVPAVSARLTSRFLGLRTEVALEHLGAGWETATRASPVFTLGVLEATVVVETVALERGLPRDFVRPGPFLGPRGVPSRQRATEVPVLVPTLVNFSTQGMGPTVSVGPRRTLFVFFLQ